ncbi:MAG: serine--tRNA ligase [Candidatus Hydrothermota bacterium]|nr:MAG: serine--tRNA ligase [Candidatus Hydrothermae bacterium]
MLSFEFLREKREVLIKALEKRGYDAAIVDELVKLDEERRRLIREGDELRRIRNQRNEDVARLKKQGADISELIAELRQVSRRIKEIEEKQAKVESKFKELWLQIPNIPHESVPIGKDETENKVIRQEGEPREFDFEPKPHWELGEKLGILDFKTAAKMSGSRFAVYKGLGAKLERALINFFLDVHTREHGYVEVMPPVLVKSESAYASGHLPKFREEMYFIEQDELFLIPTAETSLANLHRDKILDEDSLPLKYVSYTPCFRREAGSYGKDVRGIIRVHQFNKVELFQFTKPEDSYDVLEQMLAHAEKILKLLKLPYRIVQLCTGDLGFASAKTYDIEVWAPGVGRWLEVSSVSNTESFQARRSNTRFRRKSTGKVEFVHTLNGSGLATPRTFIAILENYQRKDGTVEIPEVLRPYMGVSEIA